MYIILSVLHKNKLDAMQVTMKAGLSYMIVIICMSMYYFALFTIVSG